MRLLAGLSLVLFAVSARADQPLPSWHPLPPPHGAAVLYSPPGKELPPGVAFESPVPLPPGVTVVVVPGGFYRPDPYDVWQGYAVNNRGRFRPRIIYDNGHTYYAADGRPFPYQNSPLTQWRP
jgi:hypothetical protein